jgi:hypothetical protein
MKKIQVIIEKTDEGLYGRIEGRKSFLPVTYGKTKAEVFKNLKALIKDYQLHEKYGDKFWLKLDLDSLQFEILYDVQAFFTEYDFLNVSAIARHANMNESLVRQYTTGKKHPSAEQAKKIQNTIHTLIKELHKSSLYVAA